MKGMIVMWCGAIVDIPAGWHLCNGTAGTPDLRNRFLVGAGDTYNVDESGGALTHTHPFTGNGHVHDFGFGEDLAGGEPFDVPTDSAVGIGTTDATDHKPPYYALAYIQKI